MAKKFIFWTPVLSVCCTVPPVLTASFLLGDRSLADDIPGYLKPVYYPLAIVATVAIALLSAVVFLICFPFTLLRDILKLGELLCGEVEERTVAPRYYL